MLYPSSADVVGAGSPLIGPPYQDATFSYGFVSDSSNVSYVTMTALQGLCRVADVPGPNCDANDTAAPRVADFAATAVPLGPDDYQRNPDLQMYPTLAFAVVPIYHLSDLTHSGLILTPQLLAQIFSGQVRTWDDPRIVDINPAFGNWSVPPNQPIHVVVESEDTGLTSILHDALSRFDASFANRTGADVMAWPGLNVTRVGSPQGYVSSRPFTISYTTYDFASDSQLPAVRFLKPSGAVVSVSPDSTLYAVLELGLTFGNNGDDPSHLTASMNDAQGAQAWPIVSYTYIVIRKTSRKAGATCVDVHNLAAFWYWFWTSEVTPAIAKRHNYVPLPAVVQQTVTNRFITDLRCDGKPVLAASQPLVIAGVGPDCVQDLFLKFAGIYTMQQPDVQVTYGSANLLSEEELEQQLDTQMYVVSRVPWTSNVAHQSTKMQFAGVAVAVVSVYAIVLDVTTLAKIFNGDIQTWLHPDIVALNPDGVQSDAGLPITDPATPIVLVAGPAYNDPYLVDILQEALPTYNGSAIGRADYYNNEDLLRSVLASRPFTLSVSPVTGDFPDGLLFAAIKRADGAVVAPSWAAVQACAAPDVYNAATNDLHLDESQSPGCYPLSGALYLAVRKSRCDMTTDAARTATVDFVEWLLMNPSLQLALQQQNVSPLTSLPFINTSNAAALQNITCQAGSDSALPLAVVIAVAAGGGLVAALGGLLGWWVWRSRSEMRALRKKFSDDNVAQECAEAIAHFNLEAVEWLKTVVKPNKIQRSFLQILHLLTEVQPFIPDQLLAQLRRSEEDEEPEDPAARVSPRDPLYTLHSSHLSGSLSTASTVHESEDTDQTLPTTKPGGLRRSKPVRAPNRVPATGDWTRKRCVYMFVRFNLQTLADETPGVAQRMGGILADVVAIGKAHGATIDHVTHQSAAFHWGVAATLGDGAYKASAAALEMTQLRQRLPHDLPLRLRVGVTHGPCDAATVSAAGHRFFVVGGPEVVAAADLVFQNAAGPCLCEVLVSDSLRHEVRYSVSCMPRCWFGPRLLWQPIGLRQQDGTTDEWMYELQQLDAEEANFGPATLQAVFQMVSAGEPPAAIREEVRRLRGAFGAQLSPQDSAALDQLLRGLPTE